MSLASIARCFNGTRGAVTMNHASVRTALYVHIDGEAECTWSEDKGRWKERLLQQGDRPRGLHCHNIDQREARRYGRRVEQNQPQNQIKTWRKSP